MEYLYTDNITCPYCNWEDEDSWELDENSAELICGSCGEEFVVERNIQVTYSTFPIVGRKENELD